ncbi:unnamed protein product [Cyprideis torosa]|uniref:Uncharacterized protein n=1 Tax=Cyprideis torosa TaxID=163714 RepID=A0A7R8ZN84_9CRUS|nr:unnamed protein product [Cyprideis torosa]CAG0887312.1 unnamed protein product [Cyprideis torosa]
MAQDKRQAQPRESSLEDETLVAPPLAEATAKSLPKGPAPSTPLSPGSSSSSSSSAGPASSTAPSSSSSAATSPSTAAAKPPSAPRAAMKINLTWLSVLPTGLLSQFEQEGKKCEKLLKSKEAVFEKEDDNCRASVWRWQAKPMLTPNAGLPPQPPSARSHPPGNAVPPPVVPASKDGSTKSPKTAAVTGIPRTPEHGENRKSKTKVSGSTQTDLRAYSMSPTVAAQLSASVRERLLAGSPAFGQQGSKTLGAIPSGGSGSVIPPGLSPDKAALYAPQPQGHLPRRWQHPHRPMTDGSLSDSNSADYGSLGGYFSPASLTGGSPSRYINPGSQLRKVGGSLTEGESLESLASSFALQIQTARANSLTQAKILNKDGSIYQSSSPAPANNNNTTGSPKLSRSSSARSSRADKTPPVPPVVPTTFKPHHASSPVHSPRNTSLPGESGRIGRYSFSTGDQCKPGYMISPITHLGRDEEVHGSAASIASSQQSSLYSTAVVSSDPLSEVERLRRELEVSQRKVTSLSQQLTNNAQVVSAFEQSLQNMTQRLQRLSDTSEKKDNEVMELRRTIDRIRQQQAMQGLGSFSVLDSPSAMRRHASQESVSSASSGSSNNSITTEGSSQLSHHSMNSGSGKAGSGFKAGKKKGWLRSSFTKAFNRSHSREQQQQPTGKDPSEKDQAGSGPMSPRPEHGASKHKGRSGGNNSTTLADHDKKFPKEAQQMIEALRAQLREKELALTDIRLDALSSAHHLDSLKETVANMQAEMQSLRRENERLERAHKEQQATAAALALRVKHEEEGATCYPLLLVRGGEDGTGGSEGAERSPLGNVWIAPATTWEGLDQMVISEFKEYLVSLDRDTSLGLSQDSILSYRVGEGSWRTPPSLGNQPPSSPPPLPPSAFLCNGAGTDISLKLRGAAQGSLDHLAAVTLVPKTILSRYVTLLTEHRRLILCGPKGTGKSYLAARLAAFMVMRRGVENVGGSVATVTLDQENAGELTNYLHNVVANQEGGSNLPSVVILENLHLVPSLSSAFSAAGVGPSSDPTCPVIIGTMSQGGSAASTTNLQLHHNFRWVLCANHMEPVKGFLARFLRRKLRELSSQRGPLSGHPMDALLINVLSWLPKLWSHVNSFLENRCSAEATIGPAPFLSCPPDVKGAQVWFTELWNYTLLPHITERVREGATVYGRSGSPARIDPRLEDPLVWIHRTYPWKEGNVPGAEAALAELSLSLEGTKNNGGNNDLNLFLPNTPSPSQNLLPSPSTTTTSSNPDDGFDLSSLQSDATESSADPLLTMLLRLQEAAREETANLTSANTRVPEPTRTA